MNKENQMLAVQIVKRKGENVHQIKQRDFLCAAPRAMGI